MPMTAPKPSTMACSVSRDARTELRDTRLAISAAYS